MHYPDLYTNRQLPPPPTQEPPKRLILLGVFMGTIHAIQRWLAGTLFLFALICVALVTAHFALRAAWELIKKINKIF